MKLETVILMKTAIYIKNPSLAGDGRFRAMTAALEAAGAVVYPVGGDGHLEPDTDVLIAAGGDGTILSAARLAAEASIPVLGVNFGRLGFLSEYKWEEAVKALMDGDYSVESRTLLQASITPATGLESIDAWPYALNEVCVHRTGASMLGVDVRIGGAALPTYWADGLLVATSSGSTAYSLSVGGPIVLPESEVLIVSPISPHNLNVRPLIVPDSTTIELGFQTRDGRLMLTLDNRTVEIGPSFSIRISKAPFPLVRVRLNRSNFIDALVSKLFWGEDIRNNIK